MTTTCICIEPRRSPYLPDRDICADCHRIVPARRRAAAMIEPPYRVAFRAVKAAVEALSVPDAYPDSDALRWMMLGWIADHEGGA